MPPAPFCPQGTTLGLTLGFVNYLVIGGRSRSTPVPNRTGSVSSQARRALAGGAIWRGGDLQRGQFFGTRLHVRVCAEVREDAMGVFGLRLQLIPDNAQAPAVVECKERGPPVTSVH